MAGYLPPEAQAATDDGFGASARTFANICRAARHFGRCRGLLMSSFSFISAAIDARHAAMRHHDYFIEEHSARQARGRRHTPPSRQAREPFSGRHYS